VKFKSDEVIRRFQARFIGGDKPGSFTMPFQARFLAFGTFAAAFVVVFGFAALIGKLSAGSAAYWFVAAYFITMLIMSQNTHDIPIRSLWGPLWRELTAPRSLPKGRHERTFCTHRLERDPACSEK